jgi:cytidylate kinase
MRFWEVRGRLAEEGGDAAMQALAHLGEGPWITVSKQQDSGGLELAGRLARATGWQAFDREICSAIARSTKTREAVLSRLDERVIGGFQDYLSQMLVPDALARIAYIQEMAHVIWGLARQGNAIIVGRGANWLLGPAHGLRVRVIAPFDARAARLADREGIPLVDAKRRLPGLDDEQVAFIRQVYNRDINDPTGYDLVINMEHLEIDVAERIVLTAMRRKLETKER